MVYEAVQNISSWKSVLEYQPKFHFSGETLLNFTTISIYNSFNISCLDHGNCFTNTSNNDGIIWNHQQEKISILPFASNLSLSLSTTNIEVPENYLVGFSLLEALTVDQDNSEYIQLGKRY